MRATNYPTDLSGDNVIVDIIAEWMVRHDELIVCLISHVTSICIVG